MKYKYFFSKWWYNSWKYILAGNLPKRIKQVKGKVGPAYSITFLMRGKSIPFFTFQVFFHKLAIIHVCCIVKNFLINSPFHKIKSLYTTNSKSPEWLWLSYTIWNFVMKYFCWSHLNKISKIIYFYFMV